MKLLRALALFATLLVQSTLAADTSLRGVGSDTSYDLHNPRHLEAAISRHIEDYNGGNHRDLQLFDFICGIVQTLLPGTVECTCNLGLVLQFACVYQEPLLGVMPAITGTLGLLQLSATLEVCTSDPTAEVPSGVCISFGGESQDISADGVLKRCAASMNGEACTSCTICDEGLGFQFDCSEIDKRAKQSLCVPANILTNLWSGKPLNFLPQFDDMDEEDP